MKGRTSALRNNLSNSFKTYFDLLCHLYKKQPIQFLLNGKNLWYLGSGCGSVGRPVASNTRGLRFKSSHRQKFIYILNICLLSTVYWKDKNKEKEAGNGPFKKNLWYSNWRRPPRLEKLLVMKTKCRKSSFITICVLVTLWRWIFETLEFSSRLNSKRFYPWNVL